MSNANTLLTAAWAVTIAFFAMVLPFYCTSPEIFPEGQIATGVSWLVVIGVVTLFAVPATLATTVREDPVTAAGLAWKDKDRAVARFGSVVVEARRRGEEGSLVVELPQIPSACFALSSETVTSLLAASVGSGDLQLGEPRFDEIVHVRTHNDPAAVATLDSAARDAIREAVSSGGLFEGGRWRLDAVARKNGRQLSEAIRAMAKAHEAMRFPSTPEAAAARLEAMARSDRTAGVRLRALQVRQAMGPVRDELLADLEQDLDGGVRFTACLARGEAGRAGLLRLMSEGSRTWRTKAALALADLGPNGDLPRIEDALLATLSDPEHAVAAAAALGRVGSPRVVEALAAAARGGPASGAVRKALAAVRERVPESSRGGLAIVEAPDEGGLSIAQSRGGLTESQ